MKKIWYLPLLLMTAMCSPEKETKSETQTETQAILPEEKSPGVYSFKLHNVYFEVDANSGARISSFKIDSQEVLSGKEVNADNWGSTFWTSPQSDWGWPPSANIDKNKYQSKIENNSVLMTSGKDEKLGYVVEKKFSVDPKDTSVVIVYKVTNQSNEKRKVAPWEITRVAPGGLTIFPSASGDKKGDLKPLMYDHDGITYFEYDANKIPGGVPKLIGDGSEGWMAYIKDGIAIIKKFGDVTADKAAPGEGEIELYANPDKTYIEIEEQGEYAELAPGKSLTWEVKWYLKEVPEKIKIEKGNKDLVNYVREVVK